MYKNKILAGNIGLLTQDNEEYIKNAPEGFDAAVGYIAKCNEANKILASDEAVKTFKENPTMNKVRVRIPCGVGKLDQLELSFQRERTFPDAKNPGKTFSAPFMGSKPRTSILGSNSQFTEVKERFKERMSKL